MQETAYKQQKQGPQIRYGIPGSDRRSFHQVKYCENAIIQMRVIPDVSIADHDPSMIEPNTYDLMIDYRILMNENRTEYA